MGHKSVKTTFYKIKYTQLMKKHFIFFIMIACFCACSTSPRESQEDFKPRYREFYSLVKDREDWLIDTFFYGVNTVYYRYEDGCLFEFSHPYCKGCKGRMLPIFNRKGKAYIINLPIDSFYRKLQNDGYEIVYDFYHAVDIVKLFEEYRIKHICLSHDRSSLTVDFSERGDSIISMYYSATEEVHRINSDSSCVMKGWSIYKEKKKSDEQLYN